MALPAYSDDIRFVTSKRLTALNTTCAKARSLEEWVGRRIVLSASHRLPRAAAGSQAHRLV